MMTMRIPARFDILLREIGEEFGPVGGAGFGAYGRSRHHHAAPVEIGAPVCLYRSAGGIELHTGTTTTTTTMHHTAVNIVECPIQAPSNGEQPTKREQSRAEHLPADDVDSEP